jgi:5-methylcytosine-specific restriction endonuclease McrA
MEVIGFLILVILILIFFFVFKDSYNHYSGLSRKEYYRNIYLKSNEWKRKRYLVFKRDNYSCVYCNARATQVHHLKYAKNIGKEPIKWLVSICQDCHNSKH